jgi:hypothetical protein
MVIYYAHTMLSYDSTIEAADVELLQRLGFQVINPGENHHQERLNTYIDAFGEQRQMGYFMRLIEECDALAFRALSDGTILSGIAKEIEKAQEMGIPVIELPCRIRQRSLDYPETKEFLYEIGFRKVKK